MHKPFLFAVFTAAALCAHAWGFYGHRRINRMAIYSLPKEMFQFYKTNLDYIEQHAVDPDRRRYQDKAEGPRHYIDLDHYLKADGRIPLPELIHRNLPVYWKDAVEKFTEDSLNAYGIVPWFLHLKVHELTTAFMTGDANRILKLSAEIGHYAADSHVPLHTTQNYNGQMTGQQGIHALWESRIPERYGDSYDFLNGPAAYLDQIQQAIWAVIAESHGSVFSVLKWEADLRASFRPDLIYRQVKSGRSVKREYSAAYIEAYNTLNENLVEERMTASSHFVASLWYTAWVNAGQPALPQMKSEVVKENNGKEPDDEEDHEH